ncbi:MAG: trigger factor [Gammaproteobacteria bacterium]|nr:trigger factor [Gammaproteobacteria bacterium]|tara:strand:- start:640 stop:1932 length:1293 start_codon:yes stop_codon:yes gene_type:complete
MDVIVETTGTLERRMRVEMPITTINQQIDSRLKSVGQTAKLKGFRPGKVPAKVVKQRYGRQVREEVVGEVLQKSYAKAITEQGLKPAGQPKIEAEDDNGKTFLFTATFEVMPDIELKDLEKIKTDKVNVTIADTDIDEMILNLRKQKAIWDSVDRKSAKGDRVVIDFVGKIKGNSFPGGEGKEFPVLLGSGQMLPDFEKGLIGVSAGDEKTLKVKFPKDYHSQELAGNKADFTVNIHKVEEENLPELDDKFIKDFNISDGGVDQFKDDIRENMNREAEQKVKIVEREQAMNGLLKANPIEIPQVLKYQEMQAMQQEAMQRMGLDDINKAPNIENFSDSAEKRVAFGLLLNQLVIDKGIEADDKMLRIQVEELCAGYENADDMIDMYIKNPQVMQQIKPMVVEKLAIKWIIENGSSKSKKISFKNFMNSSL